MKIDTGWYLLYTKPNREHKVHLQLAGLGIQSYLPLLKSAGAPAGRKPLQTVPLFPSYVFVHIHVRQLPALKKLADVRHVMYWRDQPARVTEEEMTTIKTVLGRYAQVQVQPAGTLQQQKLLSTHGHMRCFSLPSLKCALLVKKAGEEAPKQVNEIV
ncbi:MAG TPA: UpxY family transcription antiterminator [Flavisolibacter sp.]|nr:UpxY family transcription antiterminator [Flavisolibacter sp.]